MISTLNATEYKAALAKIEDYLHRDEFIKYLSAQLADPNVRAQAANALADDASQLASSTITAYRLFEQADSKFASNVIDKLDWVEENFEEAKRLVKQFLERSDAPLLQSESSIVSQRFTDEGRLVKTFDDDFSAFVSKMRDENRAAQIRLEGNIAELNAEIEKYNSAAEQIKRALIEIAGIPWWLTWMISEILGLLGFTTADEARRALDSNYAEQERLNERKRQVQKEIQEKQQMDYDLAIANNALAGVKDNITKILGDLHSFSTLWINNHHDIEAILERMNYAEDSATKRSLISRLKLLGTSIESLDAGMRLYVNIVEASGLF
ncbi:hypothetical protein CVT24_002398 [Panaeolus cyanescens]|uniref:Alpha-xenorhabdolysin family binary toxin subunit A n=1 Tax=Panaeolus cyanescens TaxID=181874 RepID=A0A409W109_9AGAR|nr:hypothetical protein CVT24_002398 [Panaeolus cyanescens]